jgi:MFS family permease
MNCNSLRVVTDRRTSYRWIVAGILMLVYASSFVDRQLLSLLIEPIRRDLNISDTRVGLLAGPAFIGLHVLALVPLGWLVDRWNRRNIIIGGAIFWTIMTAGCGMVGSYWPLFAMRAGVGFGEAALSPSAYSLLSDYFPKAQLGRALSVYGLGVPIGSSIAMIFGGWLIAAFNNVGPIDLGGLGVLRAWQMVFLAVAVPGIPLALLVMLIREPEREVPNTDRPTLRVVCKHVWAYRSIYLPTSLGSAFMAVAGYGAAYWLPTILQRAHGFSVRDSGLFIGFSILSLGVLGTFTMGWLTDRFVMRGKEDGALIVGIGNAIGMILCCGLAPFISVESVALALAAGTMFFLNTWNVGVAAAIIQRITPDLMRGRVSGLHIVTSALIGLGVGPLAIGLGTDLVFGRPEAVAQSLALVSTLFLVAAAGLMVYGRRPLRDYVSNNLRNGFAQA